MKARDGKPERNREQMADELLTAEERELVQDLGRIYTRMMDVVRDERTRDDDLREIRFHIHGLQRMLMAQAAARAYPSEFRLLGGGVSRNEEVPQ
jgi:hypothetical protein